MAGVTRRALLVAGGATLVAGCGTEELAAPPPADALLGQLAAERALLAALAFLTPLAPREDRALVRRLGERSADRIRRLAAAASVPAGRPPDAPRPAPDPELAVRRARAALAEHVAAVPSRAAPDQRRLAAHVVAESAADLALLGEVFGIAAADDPFPGELA
jgi:hypothetical protein